MCSYRSCVMQRQILLCLRDPLKSIAAFSRIVLLSGHAVVVDAQANSVSSSVVRPMVSSRAFSSTNCVHKDPTNAQREMIDVRCPMCKSQMIPVPDVECRSYSGRRNGKQRKPSHEKDWYFECDSCGSVFTTYAGEFFRVPDDVKQPPKLTPKEIVAQLDKSVIEQQSAKQALAVAFHEHVKRLKNNENTAKNIRQISQGSSQSAAAVPSSRSGSSGLVKLSPSVNVKLDKSNVLLLGPSGVGKTFLTKEIAKLSSVPIAFANCTTMTQAGYVGDDVDTVIQRIFENSQFNVKLAESGVVFLDEFDKIASTTDSHHQRDVSGSGVQQAMLKMLEGDEVAVKTDRKNANGQAGKVIINTTNILFIASGAFTKLHTIVGRRLDQSALGFGTSNIRSRITADDTDREMINRKKDALVTNANQDDLIKYGLIPELVGRFPIIVPFHTLTKEILVRIQTEPENSLFAQQQRLFELENNVDLQFTDGALAEIADVAIQAETGARALRSIMERALQPAKFEVPGSNIKGVLITRECVRGEAPPKYS